MERGWPHSPALSLFDGGLSVPQTPQTPWPATPGHDWQPATPSQDWCCNTQHEGFHGGAHSAGLHQVYWRGPSCEPVDEMQDKSWANRQSSSASRASTEALDGCQVLFFQWDLTGLLQAGGSLIWLHPACSTAWPGELDRGIPEVIPQAVSLRRKGLGRAGAPEKSGQRRASACTACHLLCPPCTADIPARKSPLPLPFSFSFSFSS